MNGLELSRSFYDQHGLPMLERDFPELLRKALRILEGHKVQFVLPKKFTGIEFADDRKDHAPCMDIAAGKFSLFLPVRVRVHNFVAYGSEPETKLFAVTVPHTDLELTL